MTGIRLERNAINNVCVCLFVCLFVCLCVCLFVCLIVRLFVVVVVVLVVVVVMLSGVVECPNMVRTWDVFFYQFDFEMCFAPQRHALFPHPNLQKWPEHVVLSTF